MPETNPYSQYNTNAAALMNAHVAGYMAWYQAAVIIYALAAIAFLAYWAFAGRLTIRVGFGLAAAGLVCQAASLGLRWRFSAHVPWNDLYGSLSVVTFAAVALFLIFGVRFAIWFAGPLVLGIADALLAYARGWNKGLEPLVPSLQSPWILIHVPVVLCAYSAFLISFATSIIYLLKKRDEERAAAIGGHSVGAAVAAVPPEAALRRPAYLRWLERVPASSKLDVITYRVTAIGELLLTVGIILGALWAHVSWGNYWQWDPKEDAALASWAVYAAYLHLHTRPAWRGPKAAWVCIAGFLSILFCYFGVNIYISGLHSYK
ncbi:MAG: c-type cytochrome biogenesis protein CcsB [Candidatus Eremiobacteraeota bacterium]|nr:c-type cytochrome biogenesis protein CcsB [Candidatus Eremiobacteraeota bacterium]